MTEAKEPARILPWITAKVPREMCDERDMIGRRGVLREYEVVCVGAIRNTETVELQFLHFDHLCQYSSPDLSPSVLREIYDAVSDFMWLVPFVQKWPDEIEAAEAT